MEKAILVPDTIVYQRGDEAFAVSNCLAVRFTPLYEGWNM